MREKTRSIPWVRLGVETSAIIFSVLLALALDDWRQNRHEREVDESVMLSLRAELERNQRLLEARLPYHEAMLDTFQLRVSPLERGGSEAATRPLQPILQPLDQIGFEEALGTSVSFATGAWGTAEASGAMTRIGIDKLFLLSGAYTMQEHVGRASRRLIEAHDRYVQAMIEGQREVAVLVGFTSALSDVVARERELCGTYRTLARRLTGAEAYTEHRCGSGNITIQ